MTEEPACKLEEESEEEPEVFIAPCYVQCCRCGKRVQGAFQRRAEDDKVMVDTVGFALPSPEQDKLFRDNEIILCLYCINGMEAPEEEKEPKIITEV